MDLKLPKPHFSLYGSNLPPVSQADCIQILPLSSLLSDLSETQLLLCRVGIIAEPVWIRVEVCGGFPGGPVVKNLPSKAGDMRSVPGGGTNITHTVEHLGPHSTVKTQSSQEKEKKIDVREMCGV